MEEKGRKETGYVVHPYVERQQLFGVQLALTDFYLISLETINATHGLGVFEIRRDSFDQAFVFSGVYVNPKLSILF